ncbi:small ribosomal subunit protein bS1m-like [Oscarella lobularis]|uniref:small ribosomal subunit protein bS1m-like n=1 Tax=Oscarella lobularis TaxID=121494 RepID=UPI0033137B76
MSFLARVRLSLVSRLSTQCFYASRIFSTDEKRGEEPSFAEMFRQSKLARLGPSPRKIVSGKIVRIIGDDIFVDVGLKFYAVVKKPKQSKTEFKQNDHVNVKLIDLEMTGHFLGHSKHSTLLEAEAELLIN